MSMVSLVDEIVDFLRERISDPISRGSHWIYPELPRVDAKMPRISVTQITLSTTEGGIGDHARRFTFTIDFDAYASSTKVVEGGRAYSGSSLRDLLIDKITTLIRTSRSYFKEKYGVSDIKILTSVTYDYDEPHDIFQKTVRTSWEFYNLMDFFSANMRIRIAT